jgi:exodeoxyribonuclease (lambda-induced)
MPWLDHPQGSEDWLQARRGVITGSRFKDARDRSDGMTEQQRKYVAAILAGRTQEDAKLLAGYKSVPTSDAVAKALAGKIEYTWAAPAMNYAMDLARERLGGSAPAKFQNAAMREGTEQEPIARIRYESMTGNLVQEVGFYRTDDGRFGLSPDGTIDDDGVLEVKTMVSSDTLFTAVVSGDVSEYIDQTNGYLWLLGRKWVDLALWIPDMERLIVRRIERDENSIEALETDLLQFSALVDDYTNKLRAALEQK